MRSTSAASHEVVLACRQLLGPLHEHLPPPQYISRRMEVTGSSETEGRALDLGDLGNHGTPRHEFGGWFG